MPTSEEIVKTIRDGLATLRNKSWYRRISVITPSGPYYICHNAYESEDILPYLFDLGLFGHSIAHAEMQYNFPGYQILLETKKAEDGTTNIDADVLDAIRDFLEKDI